MKYGIVAIHHEPQNYIEEKCYVRYAEKKKYKSLEKNTMTWYKVMK